MGWWFFLLLCRPSRVWLGAAGPLPGRSCAGPAGGTSTGKDGPAPGKDKTDGPPAPGLTGTDRPAPTLTPEHARGPGATCRLRPGRRSPSPGAPREQRRSGRELRLVQLKSPWRKGRGAARCSSEELAGHSEPGTAALLCPTVLSAKRGAEAQSWCWAPDACPVPQPRAQTKAQGANTGSFAPAERPGLPCPQDGCPQQHSELRHNFGATRTWQQLQHRSKGLLEGIKQVGTPQTVHSPKRWWLALLRQYLQRSEMGARVTNSFLLWQ